MATISQSYFHFDPYPSEKAVLDELSGLVAGIAERAAISSFNFNVSIEIALTSGSLKGWVTASAAITAISIISSYSDFKESVKEIYEDSKWFALQVNERVIENRKIQDGSIIRTERRTKAIGRLNRMISTLEQITSKYDSQGIAPSESELNNLERQLRLVRGSFTSSELEHIEKGLNAPGAPPIQIKFDPDLFAIRPREPMIEMRKIDSKIRQLGFTPPLLEYTKKYTSFPTVIDTSSDLSKYFFDQEKGTYPHSIEQEKTVVKRVFVQGKKRLFGR